MSSFCDYSEWLLRLSSLHEPSVFKLQDLPHTSSVRSLPVSGLTRSSVSSTIRHSDDVLDCFQGRSFPSAASRFLGYYPWCGQALGTHVKGSSVATGLFSRRILAVLWSSPRFQPWLVYLVFTCLFFVSGPNAEAADSSTRSVGSEFLPNLDQEQEGRADSLNDHLPSVDFRLEASLNEFVFSDNEMGDAYSTIPILRTGLTMDIGPSVQFLISVGYGSKTGYVEINDPTFEGDPELKLKLVPIQLGFRSNTTRLQSFRINVGAFLQAVWMEESAPYFDSYPYFDSGISTDTGWCGQVLLSLGPEWRFTNQKWVVGIEGMAGLGSGNVGGVHEREISLEGFGGRIYCSVKLGTIKEDSGTREVQP